LALATLTFGCGGSESSDFGDASGSGSSVKPGQDAGPSTDDATVSGDDPDAQVFVPSPTGDDSGIVTQGACAAGIYQGKFLTYVGAARPTKRLALLS
jgi:hypothetical protein